MKMIHQLLDENQRFTDQFYSQYSLEQDLEVKFENFSNDIKVWSEKIQIDLFKWLNYSVIEGEYINDDFFELADKIKDILNSIYKIPNTSFIGDLNEEGRYSNFLIKLKVLEAFELCVEEYINTAKYIHRIFSEPQRNKNFVIDLSDKSQDILNELNVDNKNLEKILVQIFTENLFLGRKEFTLRNSESDLQKLLHSKHTLKKCEDEYPFDDDEIKTILYLLKDKNTFLTRKLIIRKYQDPSAQNHYYVLLGEENSFSLENHPYILKVYQEWDNYSLKHFLSEKNEVYNRELVSFSLSNQSYWNRHREIKQAKDIAKNLSILKRIKFSNIDVAENSFNSFAKKISENYLKNNILSLAIENEKAKISLAFDFEQFIIDEQEKINKIQSQSVISNFFPYKKVASFIIEYLDYLNNYIKNNIEINAEIIHKIEIANIHLEQVTEKYKSALNWCKNHFYYSYQLPLEECKMKYVGLSNEIYVFSPSSFSLPLNYSDLLIEIDVLESRIISNKDQINNLNTFSSLFERLDTKLLNQEKTLEENRIKSLELLGIFSAIIALIFQGVNTAQSSESFETKFLTFVSLFIVLTSFLLLIRKFADKKQSALHLVIWFFIYLVILLVIISMLRITIVTT